MSRNVAMVQYSSEKIPEVTVDHDTGHGLLIRSEHDILLLIQILP
jgi:hypothetical protein